MWEKPRTIRSSHGKRNYDDVFDDVMHYVNIRYTRAGVRKQIRSQADLQQIFENLNKEEEFRRTKTGQRTPKLPEQLMKDLSKSNAASRAIGKVVGRFGNLTSGFVLFRGSNHKIVPGKGTEQQHAELRNLPPEQRAKAQARIDRGGTIIVKGNKAYIREVVPTYYDAKTGKRVSRKVVEG